MDDVTLGYVGGCGGFFALHLLLLSNRYNCSLPQSLDDILQHQWNIQNPKHWKSTEVCPDNAKTLEEFASPRLFFQCNPSIDNWQTIKHRKVLIYTNLNLHLKLSKHKHCGFYHPDVHANSRSLDYHFSNFYAGIRDSSWPDCDTIEQIKNLPEHVINELQQNAYFVDFTNAVSWEQWFLIQHKNYSINHEVVYKDCFDLAQSSTHVIDLKDIVASQGTALLEPLGLSITRQHKEFIIKWVNLHPLELKQLLGVA